tara:strand:+ start:114 stop:362 length:249 start_codon:yes stop_codon:yes gene_type:complete
VKYTIHLIETTLHQVEVECSSFDNPEKIASRLWKEGLLVDPDPQLLHLDVVTPVEIIQESDADDPHPEDTGKDGWRLESPYV